MKGVYELVAENKRLVLRALAAAPPLKNYLVSHAVRSAVYSVILGSALKLVAVTTLTSLGDQPGLGAGIAAVRAAIEEIKVAADDVEAALATTCPTQ